MEMTEFFFPFKPYDIQLEFMHSLYNALEKGNIGFFESPTGTGKSLSIICGGLKWLRDNEGKLIVDSTIPSNLIDNTPKPSSSDIKSLEDSMPRWLREKSKEIQEKKTKKEEEERKEIMQNQRLRLKRIRDMETKQISPTKKVKLASGEKELSVENLKLKVEGVKDVDQYLLDDYDSDEEKNKKTKSETELYTDDDIEKEDKLKVRKIFYTSRTHSQLSQFINEIKNTIYKEDCKLVVLGSRKTLCINPSVNHGTAAINQINDKCLDMMKHTKIGKEELTTSSCEYFTPHYLRLFTDHVHSQIRDIEEIVSLGKSLKSCSYYGSRASIESAEFVVLPYQMLLHKPTRESIGIDLNGQIIIIDEAHNLIDTIGQIYSVQLNITKIAQGHAQLSQYKEKYYDRLNPNNRQYIEKILFILTQLLKFLKMGPEQSEVLSLNEFVYKAKFDNLNLFKIDKYLQNSDIIRKVNSFCNDFSVEVKTHRSINDEDTNNLVVDVLSSEFNKHRPALGTISSFFQSLFNHDNDGVIHVKRNSSNFKDSSLTYVLLNPEAHFLQIVKQAKAIVLTGGTLHPIDYLQKQLFGINNSEYLSRSSIFQCGHVIPDNHLQTLIFSIGPTKKLFKFDYDNRFNVDMIKELGILIINVCQHVPDGVIVFFSSYSYQDHVLNCWLQMGIIDRLEKRKKMFRETQNTSSIEEILMSYSNHILDTNSETSGAILTCVIGGKMSEGINFKDRLGRCVIVVGLPYPNKTDPILQQRLQYLQKNRGINESAFYDSMCFNALNQSIGRAIRHSADYASILLVDSRYSRLDIRNVLPKWIGKSVDEAKNFGEGLSNIIKFFKTFK